MSGNLFAQLDSLVRAIAKAWDAAPSANDGIPYRMLVDETVRLSHELVLRRGVTIIPVNDAEPYRNAEDMFRDIETNEKLLVSDVMPPYEPGHPLFEQVYFAYLFSGERNQISADTLFRAVHDYFGHFVAESPFNGTGVYAGEVAAWRTHSRLLSGPARRALFSEVIGQLAVYYVTGSFPPVQRAVLLPDALYDAFERYTRPFPLEVRPDVSKAV
jgi:hypothetical protein